MEEGVINEKFLNVNKTLDNHENRISDVEDDCTELDKKFQVSMVEIGASLKELSKLPAVLDRISENMLSMEKRLDKSIQKQDEFERKQNEQGKKLDFVTNKIEAIDNEGTVNIRKTFWTYVKDHILGIIIAGLIATGVFALIVKLYSA